MIKHYSFFLVSFLFLSAMAISQEIKQFGLEDFDLRGNVKTCQVITDYGQEIFEFDILGRLVQVTTQYNDQDKDVTSYKFDKDQLMEKRVESFKDNELDLSSSMAYLYTMDSTETKTITEQIISYDREFVEVQEYQYDQSNRLSKIITSHQNAVDEVKIEYTAYKNETTRTYFENGIVQKSIRESTKKRKGSGSLKVVLTKNYVDGEPDKAIEQITDSRNLLISEKIFFHDLTKGEFVLQKKHSFEYDPEGVLVKEIINKGNAIAEKNYIFQFDDNEEPNWVKKITTPENTFTTRRIDYYPKAVADLEIPKD